MLDAIRMKSIIRFSLRLENTRTIRTDIASVTHNFATPKWELDTKQDKTRHTYTHRHKKLASNLFVPYQSSQKTKQLTCFDRQPS